MTLSADQPQILVQWTQDITTGEFGYRGSSVRTHEDKLRHWMDALCSVVLESRDINEKYQISEFVRKFFQLASL